MPIHGIYFAKKSKETISELLCQPKSHDYIRKEVGNILQKVLYASGKEEANKIIEELNLTDILSIRLLEE